MGPTSFPYNNKLFLHPDARLALHHTSFSYAPITKSKPKKESFNYLQESTPIEKKKTKLLIKTSLINERL